MICWLYFFIFSCAGLLPFFCFPEEIFVEKLATCWALCGVMCWVLLLFWGVYVFFPYTLWALRQKNKLEWDGFFDPPIELRQAKYVRRLFLFNKIGIWVMCVLGGLLYIGSLLSACDEQKTYQPIVSGFVYPLIFFSFIFAVFCVIYSIVRFVKNFNVVCSCICRFFSDLRKIWKENTGDKAFSDRQKIFLGLSLVSESLLIAAMCDSFTAGFYVFLRIVVCSAFLGKILERFPAWCNLFFILAAILYNPLLPIHLGGRKVWMFFNAVAILVLIAAEIATIHKFLKRSNS